MGRDEDAERHGMAERLRNMAARISSGPLADEDRERLISEVEFVAGWLRKP